MMEPESIAVITCQSIPILARLVEQRERPDHICLHESIRSYYGAIDMALRGEMDDGVRMILRKCIPHLIAVADIPLNKHMITVALQGSEIPEVTGIGQVIEIYDA